VRGARRETVCTRDERTTQQWTHAKDVKEISGHRPRQLLSNFAAGQRQSPPAVGSERREHPLAFAERFEPLLRDRPVFLERRRHQPVSVGSRDAPEHDGVDRTEQGGVGPDAQRGVEC
jgi:hypothetical protein